MFVCSPPPRPSNRGSPDMCSVRFSIPSNRVSCANSGRGIQGLQLMVTRHGIENSKKSISCDISAERGGSATAKAGLRQIRLYCDTI